MFKYVQIMCAKYNELRYMCLKNCTSSKFALISLSGLKDENLIKTKPTRKLKHATLF